MEKRKVTISIGGQLCSFYSDDSDEYISALEQKANAVMKQTAGFSGSSSYRNAVLSVLFLTDELLRAEQGRPQQPEPDKLGSDRPEREDRLPAAEQKIRKSIAKSAKKEEEKDKAQVSVWDLLNDQRID